MQCHLFNQKVSTSQQYYTIIFNERDSSTHHVDILYYMQINYMMDVHVQSTGISG